MRRIVWLAAGLAGCSCSFDSDGTGQGASSTGGWASSGVEPTGSSTTATTATSTSATSTTTTGVSGTTQATTGDTEQTATAGSTGEPACADPDAWFDADWDRRRRLTIDNTGVGQDLAGVPVLVTLGDNVRGEDASTGNGTRLRFVDATNCEVLPFEVDTWPEEGDARVWIRLAALPAEDAPAPSVWMYYDNSDAADGQDAPAVWSSFESVHHMEAEADSTGNGHDAITTDDPGGGVGQIGAARDFNGSGDYLELTPESDFDFTTELTIEAWVRVDQFTVSWQSFVTKGDFTWRLQRHNNTSDASFGTNNAQGGHDLRAMPDIEDQTWHYLVATYGDDTKRIFVDGELISMTQHIGPLVTDDHGLFIGANDAGSRHFDGRIDEVRIAGVARSPGWVAVQYRSMTDQLVAFGEEEQAP